MQHALTLSGISKDYGDVTALHPTDLSIQAGEFLTLLGPSGSGKTTLLMAIAGFVDPSAGRMELDGRDITAIAPESRNFGVVFQGYALFPHLTVWENVWFPLRARNISRKAAREAVEEALELMELGSYAQRLPKALSGGQQQRVALARALVFKPELLLLDEPLSALDKSLRKTLQTELKSLHRKLGTTFVYVTHDQEEALSMSDRIAILRDGRIQQLDAPDTLYWKPRSPFVAGFLGRSNFLPGKVVKQEDNLAEVLTDIGTIRASQVERFDTGAKVSVAIRPEKIFVHDAPSDSINQKEGRVVEATFLGTHLDLEIDVSGAVLSVTVPSGLVEPTADFKPGKQVWLSWSSASALVLPAEEPKA